MSKFTKQKAANTGLPFRLDSLWLNKSERRLLWHINMIQTVR